MFTELNKKPEGRRIPPGKTWWALVIAFSAAIAALFFGLWLMRPHTFPGLSTWLGY